MNSFFLIGFKIIIIILIVVAVISFDLSNATRLDYRYYSVSCGQMSTRPFALNKFMRLIKTQRVASPLQCLTRLDQNPSGPIYLAMVIFQLTNMTWYQCDLLYATLSTQDLYAVSTDLRDTTLTPYCRYYDQKLGDVSCDTAPGTSDSFTIVISPMWPTHRTMLVCETSLPTGDWTLIQKREDGSVNFTRSWHDYKVGFGSLQGEFWYGLENIHRLMSFSSSYTILFDMIESNGRRSYAYYDDFSVADESDGYRLSIGPYIGGGAGDSFSSHDGAVFDTFDRLPRDPNACPETYLGGFWYSGGSSCHQANPNGLYGSTAYKKGVNWETLTGFYRSLRKLKIKLRSTN